MENLKEHPLYRKHTLDTVMSSLWEFYRKKFLVLFITSFILSVTTHLLMLNFNLTELQNFTDPMEVLEIGQGGINVIDLANIYSCPFIATQDLGTVHADFSFTVNGRFDNSDLRGCNLMIV